MHTLPGLAEEHARVITYLLRRIFQAIVVLIGVTLVDVHLRARDPGRPGPRGTRSPGDAGAVGLVQRPQRVRPADLGSALAVLRRCGGSPEPRVLLQGESDGDLADLLAPAEDARAARDLDDLRGHRRGAARILQVVRRFKPIDYVLTALSFIFYAMPAFLLGTLLILYLAIDLKWFPISAPNASTVGGLLSIHVAWSSQC